MIAFILAHSTVFYVAYAVIQGLIMLRVLNFMAVDAPGLFFVMVVGFAPVVTGILLIEGAIKVLKFVMGTPK